MNAFNFAEQLKASAAQAANSIAAVGAKFDEMAATDDYVQSEGYNNPKIKSKTKATTESSVDHAAHAQPGSFSRVTSPTKLPHSHSSHPYPHPQQQQQSLDGDDDDGDASTISTHSSAPLSCSLMLQAASSYETRPWSSTTNSQRESESKASSHERNNLVPLKVHVPEPLTPKTFNHSRQQWPVPSGNTRKQRDDDSDSSNDDDAYDPIMAYSRTTQAGNGQGLDKEELQAAKMKTKNHRFMDDLETRMAMPEMPTDAGNTYHSANANAASGVSNGTSSSPWNMTAFLSNNPLAATVKKTMAPPPLARNKQRYNANNEMDNVVVVSSTAFLGETELRELEQMRLNTATTGDMDQLSLSSSSSFYQRLTRLDLHRGEVFIAFTLLLALLVYLFTNSFSMQV
jgi:hypothetical protein